MRTRLVDDAEDTGENEHWFGLFEYHLHSHRIRLKIYNFDKLKLQLGHRKAQKRAARAGCRLWVKSKTMPIGTLIYLSLMPIVSCIDLGD